jgi:hypothetical protein
MISADFRSRIAVVTTAELFCHEKERGSEKKPNSDWIKQLKNSGGEERKRTDDFSTDSPSCVA